MCSVFSAGDGGLRTDGFARDDRGVSTTMGFVITLGITAVLISGLLIAGGTLVKDEREVVARDQLAIASEQLATGLSDADQLAANAGDGEFRVEFWLPDGAGGSPYSFRVEPQGGGGAQPYTTRLVAESGVLDVSRSVTVRTSVEVAATNIDAGPVVVRYVNVDADPERELVVEDADQAPAPDIVGGLPPPAFAGLDTLWGGDESQLSTMGRR